MATKKNNTKKSIQEKTTINKIAVQVGYLAGGLIAGKDHLVEKAGDAIESVKSTIQNIAAKKKSAPKRAVKARAKKAITKIAGSATKKSGNPAAVKKDAAPKKAIKKAPKKVVKKLRGTTEH